MTLLYLLAEYHSLAKMRMHTDASLAHWERVIKAVTDALREFQVSSSAFKTTETPTERNARISRATKKQKGSNQTTVSGGSQPRKLDLQTYKFHAMGDGPSTVRRRGTLDSYSTQTVSTLPPSLYVLIAEQGEREHRVPKSMYKRTSKNRDSTRQVAAMDQKTRNLIAIAERCPNSLPPGFPKHLADDRHIHRIEPFSEAELKQHHTIGGDNEWFHLPTWLNKPNNAADPALKVRHPTRMPLTLTPHRTSFHVSRTISLHG
jgi:hypothetical protein